MGHFNDHDLLVDPSCPVNWDHPLACGLLHFWIGLPNAGWAGSDIWQDVTRGARSPRDYPVINSPEWKRVPHLQHLWYIDFVDAADRCESDPINLSPTNCTVSWYATHDSLTQRSVFRPGAQSSSWLIQANSGLLAIRTGSTTTLTGGTALMTTNKWHACSISFNSDPLQQGWIDAEDAGSLSLSLTTPGGAYSVVGSLNNGSTAPYVGGIMCLVIHDRPLTQGEVSDLSREMHAGFPGLLNWIRTPTPRYSPVSVFVGASGITLGSATLSSDATRTLPAFTGSAALLGSQSQVESDASFTIPARTATASLSPPTTSIESDAAHAKPSYAATATVSATNAVLDAPGVFDEPVYTASVVLMSAVTTLSSEADFSKPVYDGQSALLCEPVTLSSDGSTDPPVFSASVALTLATAALESSADFTTPSYTGDSILQASVTVLSSEATQGQPVFSAASALTAAASVLESATVFTAPTYAGVSSLQPQNVSASASATHSPPEFTCTSQVSTGNTTLDASATFASAQFTGLSELSVTVATLASVATHSIPTYAGESNLYPPASTLSSVATFDPPSFAGTSDLVVGVCSVSSLATSTEPVFSASVVFVLSQAYLDSTAAFEPPDPLTGSASLVVSPASLSASQLVVHPDPYPIYLSVSPYSDPFVLSVLSSVTIASLQLTSSQEVLMSVTQAARLEANLYACRREDTEITVTVTDAEDVDGWEVTFQLLSSYPLYENPLVEKTVGSGIEILSPTTDCKFKVSLSADDLDLPSRKYDYTLSRTGTGNNKVLASGSFTILPPTVPETP